MQRLSHTQAVALPERLQFRRGPELQPGGWIGDNQIAAGAAMEYNHRMPHAWNPAPLIFKAPVVNAKREPDGDQHGPVILLEHALQIAIDNLHLTVVARRNELDASIESQGGRAVVIR